MKKVVVLSRKKLFTISSSVLVECRIRLGGKEIIRQSIEHPGCVVIIPEIAPNRYLLVRQYRYAVRGYLWEFPAGGVEKNEPIRSTATRELMEETGHKPGKLKKLLSFYPTPGISEEKMHVFYASRLRPAYAEKDEDEEFELKIFSREQIGAMIRTGKIEDAKTIIGYYLLKK